MNPFRRRPSLRWIVPVLAAVVLGTAGVGLSTLSATARDTLTPRTASQLLVDVQQARLKGLSGTVVQTSDLGLPALPSVGGSSADFSSLVSGSHTLRVWYAGPDKARVALLGDLGESDLVHDGSDLWLWSSSSNTAQHVSLPAHSEKSDALPEQALTPQQAADLALKAITPTTRVTTDPTAVVAGRRAYQLVLTPKDTSTLVGSIRIAIDGRTHIPLRVQMFPRGATTPAFEVGFTSFDPTVPSDSVFAFDPPPGAKVTQGLSGLLGEHAETTSPAADHADDAKPTVVGTGWTSVVVAQAPDLATGPLADVVRHLPTVSGTWGSGHLLRGTLFTVLLTDDGRVVAGAVGPDALYAALAAS